MKTRFIKYILFDGRCPLQSIKTEAIACAFETIRTMHSTHGKHGNLEHHMNHVPSQSCCEDYL